MYTYSITQLGVPFKGPVAAVAIILGQHRSVQSLGVWAAHTSGLEDS